MAGTVAKSKAVGRSASPANVEKVIPPRSSSRLETTFDSSDGVVTQTVCGMTDATAKSAIKGLDCHFFKYVNHLIIRWKVLTFFFTEIDSVAEENEILPMKPLAHRTSPYSYLRSLGGLNKNLGSNIRLTPENVQPGRKPHLALSSRPAGNCRIVHLNGVAA